MKCLPIAVLLCAFSVNATAQHSDIWLILNGSSVAVSPLDLETGETVLIDRTTGYFLFDGDFGDLGQGPFGTDDPGYQAEGGTFQPGVILGYVASDQLRFWNGARWTTSLPDSERLHLTGALGTDTIWDRSGVTNAEGAVDQILSDGSIHSHLDFTIENSSGTGNPAAGVYLVELAMLARNGIGGPVAHELSAPFRIALNHQLSAQEFESAINALTSPPEAVEDNDIPFLPLPFMAFLAAVLIAMGFRPKWR